MEHEQAFDSPLAWSWVIEALATNAQVEMALIYDLIDSTPELSENLNEEARERVAFRNLEGLCDPTKVLSTDVPLCSDQDHFQFDSSNSFTHALKHLMDQASASSLRNDGSNPLTNLRNGASDKLMREVHAFVEKKKASLPKSALQELRDILQNGDACHETYWKREQIFLQIQERMQDCPIDVQSDKELGHDKNGFIASAEQNLDMQDFPVDGQSCLLPPRKKPRHDSNGSISSKEKTLAPVISSGIQDCPVDGKSPPRTKLTEKKSDPLISSDTNQPYRPSWKPAQPIGLLTWWPCDVSVEEEKGNTENSSSPVDSAEQHVCIKCGKGGEVLMCTTSSCLVVVHERCLVFTQSIDSRDDFLCPFCTCSSSKSVYAAAKEKMLLDREKLSLFVGGNPDHQSKGYKEVNENPQRQDYAPRSCPKYSSEEEGITGRNCQVERPFTIFNEVDPDSVVKQHEGNLAQDNVHTSPPNCLSKEEGESIPAKSSQLEKRFVTVNENPPRQGSDERTSAGKGKGVYQAHLDSKVKQHKGHLAQDDDITAKICQLEKGGQMIPIEQFHYAGGYHGTRTQKQLNSPSKNASCASSGKLYGTPQTKNQTAEISDNFLSPQSRRKLDDQVQGTSSATLHDSDGFFSEENCRGPTLRSSQRVKREYKARKRDMRMRVPWTEEEVEMLKEGMKRFGSEDIKVIPWSTILDFGSKVFWKGRSGVDLKDKWRNLIKANPELRRV